MCPLSTETMSKNACDYSKSHAPAIEEVVSTQESVSCTNKSMGARPLPSVAYRTVLVRWKVSECAGASFGQHGCRFRFSSQCTRPVAFARLSACLLRRSTILDGSPLTIRGSISHAAETSLIPIAKKTCGRQAALKLCWNHIVKPQPTANTLHALLEPVQSGDVAIDKAVFQTPSASSHSCRAGSSVDERVLVGLQSIERRLVVLCFSCPGSGCG